MFDPAAECPANPRLTGGHGKGVAGSIGRGQAIADMAVGQPSRCEQQRAANCIADARPQGSVPGEAPGTGSYSATCQADRPETLAHAGNLKIGLQAQHQRTVLPIVTALQADYPAGDSRARNIRVGGAGDNGESDGPAASSPSGIGAEVKSGLGEYRRCSYRHGRRGRATARQVCCNGASAHQENIGGGSCRDSEQCLPAVSRMCSMHDDPLLPVQ